MKAPEGTSASKTQQPERFEACKGRIAMVNPGTMVTISQRPAMRFEGCE